MINFKYLQTQKFSKYFKKYQGYFYIGSVSLVIFLLYKNNLNDYFIADDFILINYFFKGNFWINILRNFVSMGGAGFLPFYRPISLMLIGLEYLLFGAHPFGYHVIGLLIHILNSILVCKITNLFSDNKNKAIGFSAGLLFAVFPLQPNTVVWISGSASEFGTFLILLSFLWYMRLVNGLRICALLSLSFFILALGTYEAAAALPLLIIAYQLIIVRKDIWPKPVKSLFLKFYIGLGLIWLGYFLIRKTVLGGFIAGYPSLIFRLSPKEILPLLSNIFANLNIINPIYPDSIFNHKIKVLISWAMLLLLVLLFLRILLKKRKTIPSTAFAASWIVIAQTPLLFHLINNPILNGRLMHLLSIGLCMITSILIWNGLTIHKTKYNNYIAASLICLLALYYSFLTHHYLKQYKYTSDLIHTTQKQVISAYSKLNAKYTIFITNYPVSSDYQKQNPNLRALSRFGMGDALSPPFYSQKIPVYILPDIEFSKLEPLFPENNKIKIFRWNHISQNIEETPPIKLKLTSNPPKIIKILYPPDNQAVPNNYPCLWIGFEKKSYHNFMLVVAINTIPAIYNITDTNPGNNSVRLDLMSSFLFRRCKKDKIYWWVVALDDSGNTLACSELRSFVVQD